MDQSLAPQVEPEKVKTPREELAEWKRRIADASKREEGWRKKAKDAEAIFRAEGKSEKDGKPYRYNIFYANVTTLRSAVYSRTPRPDVRRRFRDKNETARDVSSVLERALSFSLDSYDFDSRMRAAVDDSLKAGRGLLRIEYIPHFGAAQVGPDGQEIPPQVSYQEVATSFWHWSDIRIGPGRQWDDVPFLAFQHMMTKKEMEENNLQAAGELVFREYSDQDNKDGRAGDDSVQKKCEVWEILDKRTRRQLWYTDNAEDYLKVVDDPWGLEGFFNCPKPIYDIPCQESLLPVCPFEVYRDLAEELERISVRIFKVTAAIRPRGIYNATIKGLGDALNSDDNEFVPVETAAMLQGAGLDAAIQHVPVEKHAQVLQQLYVARDNCIRAIYDVTGISDVMRSNTNPNETLGAQQLKAQYGSLRLQERQKEVARFARDIMRMKAEIIAQKFLPATLQLMTGIEVSPEMLAMLRQDMLREYNVDIETDSTIAADEAAEQESVTKLLTSITTLWSSLAPFVQTPMNPAGGIPLEIVKELTLIAARRFKGVEAFEDTLEKAFSPPANTNQQTGVMPNAGIAGQPQAGVDPQMQPGPTMALDRTGLAAA